MPKMGGIVADRHVMNAAHVGTACSRALILTIATVEE